MGIAGALGTRHQDVARKGVGVRQGAILATSQRAIDAAAARVSAAAAPVVTIPASAPVAWAMRRLAASCSSPISTDAREAAAIASTTSGAITAPPSRVKRRPH